MGGVLPRTRFVVFKTPLNEALSGRLPREQRFTLNELHRTVSVDMVSAQEFGKKSTLHIL